jgi:hypothetical protein
VRLPFLDLAPEAFEIIELPLLGRKDVDDDVPKVEQNPSAVGVALHPLDRMPLRFGVLHDRIGNCPRLDLRTAGHQHERIREYRAAMHVDSNEIFALFFERGVANDVD